MTQSVLGGVDASRVGQIDVEGGGLGCVVIVGHVVAVAKGGVRWADGVVHRISLCASDEEVFEASLCFGSFLLVGCIEEDET